MVTEMINFNNFSSARPNYKYIFLIYFYGSANKKKKTGNWANFETFLCCNIKIVFLQRDVRNTKQAFKYFYLYCYHIKAIGENWKFYCGLSINPGLENSVWIQGCTDQSRILIWLQWPNSSKNLVQIIDSQSTKWWGWVELIVILLFKLRNWFFLNIRVKT